MASAVVSAGEEYSPLVNETYRHCGVYTGKESSTPFGATGGFASGCGAVTFVLESFYYRLYELRDRAMRVLMILAGEGGANPPRSSRDWDRLFGVASGQAGYVTNKQAAEAGYSLDAARREVEARIAGQVESSGS